MKVGKTQPFARYYGGLLNRISVIFCVLYVCFKLKRVETLKC